MNIIALISALAGLFILIMIVIFGNKIKNRWLRCITILIGVFYTIETYNTFCENYKKLVSKDVLCIK